MAGSFFGQRKKKRIDKKVPMRTLGKGGCHVCPLKDTCEQMTCTGELDNDIALIVDRPSVTDERSGEFLTGSKWQQLKSAFPSGWLKKKITIHGIAELVFSHLNCEIVITLSKF